MLAVCLLVLCQQDTPLPPPFPGLVRKEFVYENAPFPECHASTLVESGGTLLAAWFGGKEEKDPSVGIWTSRRENEKWTTPVEVADGIQPDGKRLPCWNPVLFQPKKGDLVLFYKVGPTPSTWWGMLKTSKDNGKTWGPPTDLPIESSGIGIVGPIKNKPVELADGTWLSGCSTEHEGWRVHFERSADKGKTWTATTPVAMPKNFSAIQPSILTHKDGTLQAIGRTKNQKVFTTTSTDAGITWSPMATLNLPNPNSGTDAVTLADGRHVLVYNHTTKGRRPLNVAISSDGKTWNALGTLEVEPGEFSYPAIIQSTNGQIQISYTWKRKKVRVVTLDPEGLKPEPIAPNGRWPEGR